MSRAGADPTSRRRVAVTGMSVACALGLETETLWAGLLGGRCGIARLQNVDPGGEPLPVTIASEVSNEALARGLQRYGLKDPDRALELALFVVGRALEDGGFPTAGDRRLAMDLVMGTGHGTLHFHHEAHRTFLERGYRALRPTSVVRIMFNRLSSLPSMRFKLTGANHVVSAACASGSVALGEAFYRVRHGQADRALAACADAGLDLPTFAAWNRLGVLSRIPDPARASRPFDVGRQGLVMGEGAAAFVLEAWEEAEARGATIHAEVLGYGASSDATHITRPDPEGQACAVRAALASAGLTPESIDYVNAHGTATKAADVAEARALRLALGTAVERVPVSSTKAQLGHLMGATAGVELACTILMLEKGIVPRSQNLEDPDPECALRFVRDGPLAGSFDVALKNAFAFGGVNSVVVLGRA